MQILTASKEIINQLIDLCSKLTPDQYSKSLDLLMDNSIGKHVRHIIEFYDILKDCKDGVISYDLREHCKKTETDLKIAVKRLKAIKKWIDEVKPKLPLLLKISYDQTKKDCIELNTSMERELVYNIEHAIHHMAIVRIAIEKEFDSIKLDNKFGVAYSTLRYRDDLCAR